MRPNAICSSVISLPAFCLARASPDVPMHTPLRRLAKLDDSVDDFLALSFMDEDFEGALTLGSFENRQGKVAAHVGFCIWSFGGFQNLQHPLRMSGRLEAGKQFLNFGFICPEPGLDRMQPGSPWRRRRACTIF